MVQLESTSVEGVCAAEQSVILAFLDPCLVRFFRVLRGYLADENHRIHRKHGKRGIKAEQGRAIFRSEPHSIWLLKMPLVQFYKIFS